MLPRRLCEELCSLNPHQDRLTVSVVWKLTLKGELLDEWMGRSIISSKAKLSYEDAQRMIDDPQYPWQHSDFPCISDAESVPTVVSSVVTLNKITKQLRFLRQKRGSLRLDQPKLSFSLDQSTGLPNGCHIYQHRESNKLIEECMLLANMAVAHKISQTYPDLALLRRHPPPKDKAIETLRDQFNVIGVRFSFSTAGELQQSLNHYVSKSRTDEGEIAMEKQVIISLCCKAMELAQYICTSNYKEEHYHHYALSVPRYTHFTSPIRRYPDVIVHRLLTAAISGGGATHLPASMTCEAVESQANVCNKKRKNSKIAEEQSSSLFLGVFIRECGPLVYDGIVAAVLDKSFDVLIPELGIIKRVYCEKLSLVEFKYEVKGENKSDPRMLLLWNDEKNKVTIEQDVGVFTLVKVILSSVQKTLKFEARIESSANTPST